MRYTKIALLSFGAGLLLGLVVIATEIDWLDRVASWLMALGIAALPIAMLADWRRTVKALGRGPRRRGKTAVRRPAPAARRPRPRKPAAPDR